MENKETTFFDTRYLSVEKSQSLLEYAKSYCKEIKKVFFFDEISSTNTFINHLFSNCIYFSNRESKQKTLSCLANLLVVADMQTQGRGRMGRSFFSPSKSGAYFSFVVLNTKKIKSVAFVTAFAAVAVCDAIEEIFGLECKIKWVNDVFFKDKKICGILTQGVQGMNANGIEAFIVGIGINISFSSILPKGLQSVAGSLKENDSFCEDEREKLICLILRNFFSIFEERRQKDAMKKYQDLQLLIGQTVTVFPVATRNEHTYKAKVLGVDDDLCLVVQKEDCNKNGQKQILHLFSGEVSCKK